MTCREFVEFLMDYVEGELSPEERRRFDAHLEECPDCVHYLQRYRDTIVAGRLVAEDDDALPSDVPERLVQAILQARRTPET